MTPRRSVAPRPAWAAIVTGSVLVGLGVLLGGREPEVDVGTVPPAASGPLVAASAVRARVPAASRAGTVVPPPRVAPVRMRIPGQGVDARVVAVGATADGALEVPDDPDVVGWWRDGAAPGGGAGTVVIDGHVDTYDRGPGALFRLAGLRPGDAVQLVTGSRTVGYTVAAVRAYAKPDLPSEVFDRTGTPRLVLISCGGSFDRARRSYRENVVVYAVPVSSG